MSLRRFLPLFLVGVAGCANANPAVQIEGAIAPDMMCLVQVTNPRIFHGTYDANFGGSYGEAIVLRSRLATRMRAPGPPTAESDDFTLTGAIITLEDVDGAQILLASNPAKFRVSATGFVPAATDTMASESVGLIPIIPQSLAADLVSYVNANGGAAQEIVARIQAYGETSGGSHIDLTDFTYPVTVCNGCLCGISPPMVSCHPGSDGEGYGTAVPCP